MQKVDGTGNSRKGRFPQNTFVDGSIYWDGTQMDETAMPIILAWKLHRVDLWPKIKLAAEFLAANGPKTGQERWEEIAGYSPSTIAAEVAGLICAASLADAANDPGAAKYYRQKADEWRNNVANWTFTSTGFHGNKKYYIRINSNQDPDDDVQIELGNGAGTHGERYIVDGGFLELVRMGVVSPKDWTILETLPEYDEILKQELEGKGSAWFRYNYDGYGEHNDGTNYNGSGRGRLWPIFTAERGIYEIASSGDGSVGRPYLKTLKSFSTNAGLIPEQVWNKSATITGWDTITPAEYEPGTATRSMQPLSWAMGEYINLLVSIKEGRSDAPEVVVKRYSTDKPQTTVTFKVKAETRWGEAIYLVGSDPLLSQWVAESGIKLSAKDYPIWSTTISLPASTTYNYKFVKRDERGQTIWESGDDRVLTTPASDEVRLAESTFR
jgi:glucoamylase